MTILSTDLKALRQCGYDSTFFYHFYLPQVADFVVLHQLVDSILQPQKARRQATEKAKLDETEKAEREETEKVRSKTSALFMSNLVPEMTFHYTQKKIPITQTNVPLPPANTVIANLSPPTTHGATSVEQTPKRSRLTSAMHVLGHHLQRNRSGAASSQLTSSPPDPDGAFMSEKPASSRETAQSQPDPTITSLSNICTSSETDKLRFHLMFHRA